MTTIPVADAALGPRPARRVPPSRRGRKTARSSSSASGRGPRRRRRQTRRRTDKDKDGKARRTPAEEPPTVDVWHPRDVDVMPKQKIGATRDRQRSLLAAWPLDSTPLTVLGARLLRDSRAAQARRTSPTPSAGPRPRSIAAGVGSAARTISLVDVSPVSAQGRATASTIASSAPVPKASTSSITPTGSTAPSTRRAARSPTSPRRVAASFVDRESDSTDVQRPWFGVAGWTTGDARSCSTTSSTSGKWPRTARRRCA